MPEGTLTVSVLANTTKIYGREIALGAVPAGQTPEKSWAGPIVGVQSHCDGRMPATVKQIGETPRKVGRDHSLVSGDMWTHRKTERTLMFNIKI